MQKLINGEHAELFPFWRERADHLIYQMGESRILYVGIKESIQMFWIFLVWKEAPQTSGLTSDCLVSVFSMLADFSLIQISTLGPAFLFGPSGVSSFVRGTPACPFDIKAPTRESYRILADLQVLGLHRPWAAGSSLYVGTKESMIDELTLKDNKNAKV